MRNSQPALWEKYGIGQSLNAGLALSACARMALTKLTGTSLPQGCPLRILRLLERALVELCWGQCLDLEQQNGGVPSLQDYLQMVRRRSPLTYLQIRYYAAGGISRYFALPSQLG